MTAGDPAAEEGAIVLAPARPVHRRAVRRARRGAGLSEAQRAEMALAVAELERAGAEVESAAREVFRQHDPWGSLPVVLALLSGAVVAVATAQSLRWYAVLALASLGALVTWIVLMIMRGMGWAKHHPLLVEMFRVLDMRASRNIERAQAVEICATVVDRYLPEDRSRPLLDNLELAEQRAFQAIQRLGPVDLDDER